MEMAGFFIAVGLAIAGYFIGEGLTEIANKLNKNKQSQKKSDQKGLNDCTVDFTFSTESGQEKHKIL